MDRSLVIDARTRWAALAVALIAFVSLFVAADRAKAVVVKEGGNEYGVALVPAAREEGSTTSGYLQAAGVPIVTSTGSCADPAAGTEPDFLSAGSWPLSSPAQPICWHNGPVMHANETFTLAWEGQAPNTYWSSTKSYVQSFLSDVAATSGSLASPYADTTQYWDGASAQDRAANSSVFGGGCDDSGTAKCRFGSITGSGAGNPLPSSSDCPVNGDNIYGGAGGGGAFETIPNNLCLTASDVQHEVTSLVDNDGLIRYAKPGHTPLVTVLTPPGVVVCLDSAGTLCSVNGRLAPPPPTLSTAAATGNPPVGTIPAGTYHVEITYMTASGETMPSASSTVTTSGGDSTITVSSPEPRTGATGWYVYLANAAGSTFTRQGGLQTIGTDDTLNSIGNSGITPPSGAASFCSYHAEVTDPQSHQPVNYVVQPWTPFTSCDEPDVPPLPQNPTPVQLEKSAGQRLVSPLSQSEMATIVNPDLNGWFGLDGLEIDDQNSCQPLGNGLDTFTFGNSGGAPYFLQRESNNAAVVDSDPYTYNGCLPDDTLAPAFVVPSAINLGDTIDLDGSATASSLGVPNANYKWNFGEGSSGSGPSVEHTYAKAGNYTTTLTVSDRGGNQSTLSQVIQVLGASGLPGGPSPKQPTSGGLQVRMQLMPQSLKSALHFGIKVNVNSNETASGIATVSITRAFAKRLHIKVGHSPAVVIGRGTVSSIQKGTVTLHLHLARAIAKKLKHRKHVALTVRLALVASGGGRIAVDAAGRY